MIYLFANFDCMWRKFPIFCAGEFFKIEITYISIGNASRSVN